MHTVEQIIAGLEPSTVEQQKAVRFWELATALADLNGETSKWSTEAVAKTLDGTGRSPKDLEAGIRMILKRRDLAERAESLTDAQADRAESLKELESFVLVRDQQVRELNDTEIELRRRLSTADELCRAAKEATSELTKTARRTPALDALRQQETRLWARLYGEERELAKVSSWVEHARAWIGISEEHRRSVQREALAMKERLERRIKPIHAELETITARRTELENDAIKVL